MSEVMRQGLMITVIGMGLVFAVIVFLWWLMGLLVKVTTKEAIEEATVVDADVLMDVDTHRRAAAAAVAVGLALEQRRVKLVSGGLPDQAGGMNPWQSVHRTRQLQKQHKRG